MYIAGLNLNQGVEGIVACTNAFLTINGLHSVFNSIKRGDREGGKILPFHDTLLAKILTPMQTITLLTTPIIFGVAVAINGLEQPHWLQRYSLPSLGDNEVIAATVRVLGCLGGLACYRLFVSTAAHLGKQFHFIAVRRYPSYTRCPLIIAQVREKANIVTDGPYAHVRHPLYTAGLLQQLANAVMFWSYIPLIAMAAFGGILAVKVPIEVGLYVKLNAVLRAELCL